MRILKVNKSKDELITEQVIRCSLCYWSESCWCENSWSNEGSIICEDFTPLNEWFEPENEYCRDLDERCNTYNEILEEMEGDA
jgi:hypothetical protein